MPEREICVLRRAIVLREIRREEISRATRTRGVLEKRDRNEIGSGQEKLQRKERCSLSKRVRISKRCSLSERTRMTGQRKEEINVKKCSRKRAAKKEVLIQEMRIVQRLLNN